MSNWYKIKISKLNQLLENRMAEKWIQKMHMKKGALHKDLGVKPGKKIPESKLKKAEHSKDPKTARRARLAETLKHMNKHKGKD